VLSLLLVAGAASVLVVLFGRGLCLATAAADREMEEAYAIAATRARRTGWPPTPSWRTPEARNPRFWRGFR
jgi:hypothetical protein